MVRFIVWWHREVLRHAQYARAASLDRGGYAMVVPVTACECGSRWFGNYYEGDKA